jgi:hypothetical protein
VPVHVHDFAAPRLGEAIPYGIYDLAANTGWVNVGTDHDNPTFAVECIRRWWHDQGQADCSRASRLLITADAGGSNGHRTRAWKRHLARLAAGTVLIITVCHLPPPGTSKWNKIEHRLFPHITMNRRGRPLPVPLSVKDASQEVVAVDHLRGAPGLDPVRPRVQVRPNHSASPHGSLTVSQKSLSDSISRPRRSTISSLSVIAADH